MVNDDIRSKARQWGFKPAVQQLAGLGIRGEIIQGDIPKNVKDVAGVMVGIADFDWTKSGSTILPGAICEHLTSYGGIMNAGAGQTPLSAFIRAARAHRAPSPNRSPSRKNSPRLSFMCITPPAAHWLKPSINPSPPPTSCSS